MPKLRINYADYGVDDFLARFIKFVVSQESRP
jgi:hypothetical protein